MEEDATRASDERLGGGALERYSSTYDFDLMISEDRSKNLLPLSRIFIIPFFLSSFPSVFNILNSPIFWNVGRNFQEFLELFFRREYDFHELHRNELLDIIDNCI